MPGVTTKDTREELAWLSDRLSAQVRAIALGVLVIAWGLIVSPPRGFEGAARGLLWVALLSLLTLVVDLSQYVVGYMNTRRHHRELIRTSTEVGYDPNAPLYRLRTLLFWTKQALACASFLALVALLVPTLLIR